MLHAGHCNKSVSKLFCEVLIAFEGIDGSGKTTQAIELSKRLEAEGIPNEVVREPGGTRLGEGVRELLLHRSDLKISPVAEFLLFSASRAQLVEEKVNPMLRAGKTVILDRYFYSSIAYQGFGRGIPIDEIEAVSWFATGGLLPDVVFLVELDLETAMRRRENAGRRADRMEEAEVNFFKEVISGFKECARHDPTRFIVVDGKAPIGKVSERIHGNVLNRIKNLAEERNAP